MGNIGQSINRNRVALAENGNVIVGHQEQQDLPNQDSQHYKDRLFDGFRPVPEAYLREKEFGRQSTRKEQCADEYRLKELITQTGKDNRHQKDGENPVGYDKKAFHYLYKNNKLTWILPISSTKLGI